MVLTYQDFEKTGDNDAERAAFVLKAVREHAGTDAYRAAVDAELYASGRNALIERYQKLLYTITGEAVPDNFTANHKCKSGFFKRFVTQRAAFLLGNGVTFEKDPKQKEKLGKRFDNELYYGGKQALIGAVAFGFWNNDHIEFFKLTEFVPLWDEETGALRAGIRYWRIDPNKPLRCTLYEEDGITNYRQDGAAGLMRRIDDKTEYKWRISRSAVAESAVGENYGSFPIVPLWASREKQSMMVGLKEQIDCYDLIKSGFANDLDDASMIYWTLSNAGGMDDVSLAQFIERMKVLRAATLEDNVKAEAHTLEVPYESREAYLARLKKDLYEDAMAVDVTQIAAGSVTATQIIAAYEPLNEAADEFEFQVLDFMHSIMQLAGLDTDDTPIFKRSQIANQNEETQMVMSASSALDDETLLKHLPFLSVDEIEGVLKRKTAEETRRYQPAQADTEPDAQQEPQDGDAE